MVCEPLLALAVKEQCLQKIFKSYMWQIVSKHGYLDSHRLLRACLP